MVRIPIKFEHEGKHYEGYFSEVTGMGHNTGSVWHLMVNKYYLGCLRLSNGKWFFDSNMMSEMADYFGEYITLWYG